MEWLASTGECGRLIVAATAGVGAATAVAAYRRVSRRFVVGLMAAGAIPIAIGAVGMCVSMFHSSHRMEMLRAPTPRDLAADVHTSLRCILLGMAGSALVLVIAAIAYTRSPSNDEPPPI